MKSEVNKTKEDNKTLIGLEKGNCLECAHYHDCPRMRGINHCFNLHQIQSNNPNEVNSLLFTKP